MPDRNRRFLLRNRPSERIVPDTFELVEEAVPQINDGEALVRVDWISLDPTNRTWINDSPTYLPPVPIGEVMRAGGLGEVVASKNPNYSVGQIVQGLVGWQEYVVASDTMPLFPVDVAGGVSPSAYLGALGRRPARQGGWRARCRDRRRTGQMPTAHRATRFRRGGRLPRR